MKANELLQITIKNKPSVSSILIAMEESAKRGCSQHIYFEYMDADTISQLAIDGYRVRQTIGAAGEKLYVISWD